MTLLALITTVGMAFGQAEFSGDGTSDSPYLINDASDWAKFTALVNAQNSDYVSAYYELTNDLTLGTENEPITTVVGNDRSHTFKGTFDGGYHTLLIYMNRTEDYAAPFGVASNATIKNLRVAGTIVSTRKWAAGIIGYIENINNASTNIINCISSVHIICDNIQTIANNKPYDCTYGGLVGQNESGYINFTNCVFDGEIVDTRDLNNKKARRCAGFIAWVNKGVSFTNCIMAGKLDVLPNGIDIDNSMATFYRTNNVTATYNNCYFINDYTYYQSKDKIIKLRQGEPIDTDVKVGVYSIQFCQDGNYYFASGAQYSENGNTMSFNGWTFNDTDYTYSCEKGAKGINHVYSNGYLTVTFTERYELDKTGDWDIDSLWKYKFVPEVGSEVTLKAAVNIPNGYVVNVKNIAVESKASIDVAAGAQFLCLNSVQATIHKDIEKATLKDHVWNTLASPVDSLEFNNVENLLSAEIHNIYRYDETTPKWEEYRNEANLFNSFESGRGYLYRTTYEGDMKFEGKTYEEVKVHLTCSEVKGEKYGINYIGNPYPHKIYKGVAISNTNLKNGYCVLSTDGEWIYTSDTTAIPSCTAFMIQTNTEQDIVIKNTAAKSLFSSKDVDNNIWFTIKNSQYRDVACIEFKEGEGFNKLQHQNENAPLLYINYDGRNYASANVSEDTQSISLCFKSKNIGMNTLSVKANGNYSYLHLIDRLTGEDVDLLMDDEYTFISSGNDNADRFIVRLSNKDNTVEDNEVFAWQNGSDIIVNGNGELQVFDITGRMVMNTMVNGVQTVNVPSQNAYIFRMIGEDIKTQKIVVK